MEQKQELSIVSSNEASKEKRQQVVDWLLGDKLVDNYGSYVSILGTQIVSYLTEDELQKAHNNLALTEPKLFNLFKPNFKAELVYKLLDCVSMGKQYEFCAKILTQEPNDTDIKEVTQMRKILFIATEKNFQICYCSDNWEYKRAVVNNVTLKKILKKYEKGQPIENVQDLSTINQILTESGIRTQQDKAERLLKTNPELMLEKISFTDCSGRIFSKISVFEFLLWALDTRYGVNMILNCLPKNKAGIDLAKKLNTQYYHHQKHGLTYTLEEITITEKHFDFSILTKALQDNIDNYSRLEYEQRAKEWCIGVGTAQLYVPAHVMQHYCDPNTPFYPLPKFDAKQFTRSLKFYDCHLMHREYCDFPSLIGGEKTWAGIASHSKSTLDVNFGILRGNLLFAGGSQGGVHPCNSPRFDLAAIKSLHKVRKSDYLAIPSKIFALIDEIALEQNKKFGDPIISFFRFFTWKCDTDTENEDNKSLDLT